MIFCAGLILFSPRIFLIAVITSFNKSISKAACADAIAKKLGGKSFTLIRQAGDRGQLYGSVSPRDVADVMEKGGFKVDRHQVSISVAIKSIGVFTLPVVLHPEVKVNITVNVARSEDEAERQARGEDVLAGRTEAQEAKVAAEELFEEGAAPKPEAEEAEAEA